MPRDPNQPPNREITQLAPRNGPRAKADRPGAPPQHAQQDRGAGFAFLLAPHPGRIRALAVGNGGVVGRAEECALRLDAPGVSPQHLRVELVTRLTGGPPEMYVTDLGSTSGTYVSGMRAHRTVLADGDLLRVGGTIALMVEHDIGTYDGNVVDESGIVRGPRSRRGWFVPVDQTLATPPEANRVGVIVGMPGTGRRCVVRKISEAWGVPFAALPWIDVGSLSESAVLAAIDVPAARKGYVLRGLNEVPASTQLALANVLERRTRSVPLFFVADEASTIDSLIDPLLQITRGARRVNIPSLEDRREEIPSMVRTSFERVGVGAHRLSIELYEALTRAAWPGEVEELVEAVERIAAAHPDVPRLGPEHLVRPLARRGGRQVTKAAEVAGGELQAEKIREALTGARGSVAAAARTLHLSRQALYREAARLGIDIRRARDD